MFQWVRAKQWKVYLTGYYVIWVLQWYTVYGWIWEIATSKNKKGRVLNIVHLYDMLKKCWNVMFQEFKYWPMRSLESFSALRARYDLQVYAQLSLYRANIRKVCAKKVSLQVESLRNMLKTVTLFSKNCSGYHDVGMITCTHCELSCYPNTWYIQCTGHSTFSSLFLFKNVWHWLVVELCLWSLNGCHGMHAE